MKKTSTVILESLRKEVFPFPTEKENGEEALQETDMAVVRWCWQHQEDAGFSTETLGESKYMFLAVKSDARMFAVIAIGMEGEPIRTFERGNRGHSDP